MRACGACSLGAVGSTGVNLADGTIMLELKSLMSLIAPSLITTESWYNAPWSAADFEGYKGIVSKLPGSADAKKKLLAYVPASGGIAMGMPPAGTVGFPSVYGIEAMAARLIEQGIMTAASLADAFPTLTAAGKTAVAGLKSSADPGVLAPSGAAGGKGGGGISPYLIAAGVGVVLVGGYFLLRKKK